MISIQHLPSHLLSFIFQDFLSLRDLMIMFQSISSNDKKTLLEALQSNHYVVYELEATLQQIDIGKIAWLAKHGFGVRKLTMAWPMNTGTTTAHHEYMNDDSILASKTCDLTSFPMTKHDQCLKTILNHKGFQELCFISNLHAKTQKPTMSGKVDMKTLLDLLATYGSKLYSLELTLHHNAMTEQDLMNVIACCPNLQSCTLHSPYDSLTKASLQYMVDTIGKSLVRLNIRQSIHMNATCLPLILSGCPKLISLTLFNCYGQECLHDLNMETANMIPNCLEHLDLSFSQQQQQQQQQLLQSSSTSDGFHQMIDGGQRNKTDQNHFELDRVFMGNAHNPWKSQSSLKSLVLKGWILTPNHVCSINRSVACSLTHLDLSSSASMSNELLRLLITNNYSESEAIPDDHILNTLPSAPLSKLTSLNLSFDQNIHDDSLVMLGKYLHHLQQVELEYLSQISDHGITVLVESNPFLHSISLRGCVNIQSMNFLNVLQTSLKHLSLRDCYGLTDQFCFNHGSTTLHSSVLSGLRSIDLHGCYNLTSAALNTLTKDCTRLESINLSGCRQVDQVAIEQLVVRHGKTLKYLSVRKIAKMTNEAINVMARHCNALEVLDIAHVSGFGLFQLVNLTQCQSLKEICIEGNTIMGRDRMRLVNAFPKKIKLTGGKTLNLMLEISIPFLTIDVHTVSAWSTRLHM